MSLQTLLSRTGKEPRVSVTTPRQFTLHDWRLVLLATKDSLKEKKIGIVAAGTAYYAVFACFAFLTALLGIAAYTLETGDVERLLRGFEQYVPINVVAILGTGLEGALSYNERNLIIAFGAILLLLYTGSRAVFTLIKALNTVYEQEESRSYLKIRLMSIGMTIAAVIIGFVIWSLLLLSDELLVQFEASNFWIAGLPYLRWLCIIIILSAVLALLYRYGPSNENRRWQWVNWGAGIASLLWIVATVLLFLYVRFMPTGDNPYTLITNIIVLLIWLNVSAYIVLIGAGINHQLEARTVRRTTV
jgi:membrane protein